MRRSLTLRIAAGDITRWRAQAITTSANAGLCGNKTPSYWRFRVPAEQEGPPVGFVPKENSRPFDNVDGQIHAAAGGELQKALVEITAQRAYLMSGGGGIWRGSLLPRSTGGLVSCLAGSAVCTPSFGKLRSYAEWIVHAVAPDGRYPNHWAAYAGIPILRDTFASAIVCADEVGASSLAVPSIGCGVNGWPAAVAADAALDAVEECLIRKDDSSIGSVQRLDFVLRGASELTAWRESARQRFGDPGPASQRTASGELEAWQL